MEKESEGNTSIFLSVGLILAIIGLAVSVASLWFGLSVFVSSSLGVQLQMLLPTLVFLVLLLVIFGAMEIDAKLTE